MRTLREKYEMGKRYNITIQKETAGGVYVYLVSYDEEERVKEAY